MTTNQDTDQIACRNGKGETVHVARSELQFRPSAYVVIECYGMVLVMRSKTGKYFFPGGGQDKGELLPDCAVRETREETGGLEVRIGKYLGVFEDFYYWQSEKIAYHTQCHAYIGHLDDRSAAIADGVGDDDEGYPEWRHLHELQARPEMMMKGVADRILLAYLDSR
jgi:8-oxo-dGTP pyrophosphatase MutT (NUDIX family)